MRSSRRHVLQTASTLILALAIPITPAQAQWLEPLLRGVTIISTALNIADLLTKWYYGITGDKRCKIDLGDLENIKLDCEVLSRTIDDEIIPLLKQFLTNKDASLWRNVKLSIAQLLTDGDALMRNVNRVIAKLDANTYPGPKKDIETLYHEVDSIRATMVIIAHLPDSPEPEDFKQTETVLGAILPLPNRAKAAAAHLQFAVDDRQKLDCQ